MYLLHLLVSQFLGFFWWGISINVHFTLVENDHVVSALESIHLVLFILVVDCEGISKLHFFFLVDSAGNLNLEIPYSVSRRLNIKHYRDRLTNWKVIYIKELAFALRQNGELHLIVDLDGAPYGAHFKILLAFEGNNHFEVLGDVTHIQNKILLISD